MQYTEVKLVNMNTDKPRVSLYTIITECVKAIGSEIKYHHKVLKYSAIETNTSELSKNIPNGLGHIDGRMKIVLQEND